MEQQVDISSATNSDLDAEAISSAAVKDLEFRKFFPELNPLTVDFFYTFDNLITYEYKQKIKEKMKVIESLPIGKVKWLIVVAMEGRIAPNIINAVRKDMNEEKMEENIMTLILATMSLKKRGFIW